MNTHNHLLIEAIELQQQGKINESSVIFSNLLLLDPGNAAALYSLSLIAFNRSNLEEAQQLCQHGVDVAPQFAPLHLVLGAIFQAKGLKTESLSSYDKALELNPNYVEALINSGVLLRDIGNHKAALERFNHVLTFDPDNMSALVNCGIILTEFKESEMAIRMFKHLIELSPNYDYALGLLGYEQLHQCDWSEYELLSKAIVEGVREGKRTCKSLAFMSFSDAAEDHQSAAKLFASQYCPKKSQSYWCGERYRHNKIKVAYVSPDLREHPVAHLLAGTIENHDKSRFEITGISLGADDGSRLRSRLINAFDQFIDGRQLGSSQIASMMRDMEIEIAIDLSGFTSDSRTDIFAYRPAPIQANYLGYPGTMGTDFMDYIIADARVIPENHQQFYNEQVVYLPDSYLPFDNNLLIAERTPTRAECGLPETGIVFCSFSHDYKITPNIFRIWLSLLQNVPNSILWLMSRNEASQQNLRVTAKAYGIDPSRVIFAERVPLIEDHLARYRLADLFLDTHPYNAHTTAADALFAGVPVLTYQGNSFPSRVASSLLHAVGLPELITHSPDDYYQQALKLGTTPSLLRDLKERLNSLRSTSPLFNTSQYCRSLEAVYIAMWRNYQLGNTHDALSSTYRSDT